MGINKNNKNNLNNINKEELVLLYRGFFHKMKDIGILDIDESIINKNISFYKEILDIANIKNDDDKIEKIKIFSKKYELIANHNVDIFIQNLGKYIKKIEKGEYLLNIIFIGDDVDRIQIFKKNNFLGGILEITKNLIDTIINGNGKTI